LKSTDNRAPAFVYFVSESKQKFLSYVKKSNILILLCFTVPFTVGSKADGIAQLFVFDLMKAHWEKEIPKSHAIELNVDIVMSSAPIYQCSESLLNILKLEKVGAEIKIFYQVIFET